MFIRSPLRNAHKYSTVVLGSVAFLPELNKLNKLLLTARRREDVEEEEEVFITKR